jgi:PPK2 family polyphosphate:nucleotide phosphotransferase
MKLDFIKKFKVKPDQKVKLSDYDPAYAAGLDKSAISEELPKNIEWLKEQQYLLIADKTRSLLVVLQGMDASGKDGAIRHVMSGMNPQSCKVTSFRAPSQRERDHDFLWRIHKCVPSKGEIGIFNRSHYEDVLIARVRELVPKEVWKTRYEQINDFEKMLSQNGVTIIKVFLYISKGEQKERLESRLKDPKKNWKFDPEDLKDREFWDQYMEAYEDVLSKCSTEWAPWFIIPSDKKWFRNLALSEIINEEVDQMNLKYPKPLANISDYKVV